MKYLNFEACIAISFVTQIQCYIKNELRNCELSFLKSVTLTTLFISFLHRRG